MHSAIVKKTVIILLVIVLSGCSAIPLDLSFPTPDTPCSDRHTPTDRHQLPLADRHTRPVRCQYRSADGDSATLEPGVVPSRTPTLPPTPARPSRLKRFDPTLFTPSPNIFQFVQESTTQIVGSTCDGDRSIMFTATVTLCGGCDTCSCSSACRISTVDAAPNGRAGAIMKDNDQGKYFYKLELDQINDYNKFEDAWLQYQLVASTVGLTVSGRSVVDRTSVSVTHCSAPKSMTGPAMKKTLPFLLLIAILAGLLRFSSRDITQLLATSVPETPADTATPQPTVTLHPHQGLFRHFDQYAGHLYADRIFACARRITHPDPRCRFPPSRKNLSTT
ncbi:MAG: hypothetical protein MZV64_23030 [Ignavibacteriales bacterium]|nr:hypothetical protein [Ignavibacteriales bacterium]